MPTMLANDDKLALLKFVRQVAMGHLTGSTAPPAPWNIPQVPFSGLFVTFRNGGRLRGCTGRFDASQPLATVLAAVTQSSLNDPRFTDQRITLEELPALEIEVSILGPLVQVPNPDELVPGRHGIVITRDGRSGCFLPQVATEHQWSIPTLLSECCRMKAGLAPDAWRDPATRIQAFEATVLRESDSSGG